jgi:hypothetical protein
MALIFAPACQSTLLNKVRDPMDHIEIPLTKGLHARVSAADRALAVFRWHAVKGGNTHYAARRVGDKTLYLHRVILGVENSGRALFVDHINRDGLDNRRENLRLSNAKQNAQNRRYATDYLGLRGVRQAGDRWDAQIGVDGKLVYLGAFLTQREAGIAYAAACRVLGRSVE